MSSSAEGYNITVGNMDELNQRSPFGLSEREIAMRRSTNLRPTTWADVVQWINVKIADPEMAAAIRKEAAQYPNQALDAFLLHVPQLMEEYNRKKAAATRGVYDDSGEPASNTPARRPVLQELEQAGPDEPGEEDSL